MKHSTVCLPVLLCSLLGTVVSAHVPALPPTVSAELSGDGHPIGALSDNSATGEPSLKRWLQSHSASFADWLADGSLLISARFGDMTQLHRVRAPSGMREQLTWSDAPITGAVAHPYDADTLLLTKDNGGARNVQLWLHSLKTGAERLLTDGRSFNGPPVFAHDGKRIAFYGNARDGASYDIYTTDITGNAAPQLAIGGGSDALYPQDWSLDDKRIAIIRQVSITDSQLLVADIATGALTRIEPAVDYKGGPMAVRQARFARDGRGVFFLSDRDGDFTALHYADLYTGEQRVLTPQTRRDVERFDISIDGRYIAYTLNEAGVNRLVLHDLRVKADVLLPGLPTGAVIGAIGFDRGSKQLAVALETSQSPRDVYVYTLGAAKNDNVATPTLARWTQSELGPIDAAQLVSAQLMEFPTWDRDGNRQRRLPAFVYKPRTPGPHPVIIDFRAGAESQSRPEWSAFTQYLVNELGYAVVAPNVRGSSGYGRSFMKLNAGVLREDPLRDIGALLVWIGAQGDFNRNRIVVMGGAAAGNLPLASLVNYGDRLAGGVIVAKTGLSPAANSAAFNKPLLIVQGPDDQRTAVSESEEKLHSIAQFLRRLISPQ
jgi:dipeptidyl aminopeptidase/acylaminoacyl peptidase